MARISALVRLSRENELVDLDGVVDTGGELIGADTIDKDILENNIMAVDAVSQDIEAVKDATRDAKELDDISMELANERETLTPFAAKMVHDRIRQLAEPYGETIRRFSRESFDRTKINRQLAREAEEASASIKEKIKAAWARLKEKAKELKDRLYKNMDYLTKRVAQLHEMTEQMGENVSEKFKFKSPITDFNKAIKELSYVAKGGTFVKEFNSALKALEKVAQYEGNEWAGKENAETRTVVQIPDECSKLYPVSFVLKVNHHGVVVDHGEEKGKPADAQELPQIDKKEVVNLLLAMKKVMEAYKTESQKISDLLKQASDLENKYPKSDVEIFFSGVSFGNYLDAVMRKVLNEATRYIEASIKASK